MLTMEEIRRKMYVKLFGDHIQILHETWPRRKFDGPGVD